MVPQRPSPASVCSTLFSRDDNRTSAGWCAFFLAAIGAPSTYHLVRSSVIPLEHSERWIFAAYFHLNPY